MGGRLTEDNSPSQPVLRDMDSTVPKLTQRCLQGPGNVRCLMGGTYVAISAAGRSAMRCVSTPDVGINKEKSWSFGAGAVLNIRIGTWCI